VTLDLSNYLQATGLASPQIVPVTALEQAIAGSQMLPVTNRTVTLTVDRALTTLSMTPGTPVGVGRMESA
jgi:hypothetical protein